MEGLGLEPYAAIISWSLQQEQPLEVWQTLIAEYLEQLGQVCAADDKRILGHIKCLVRFPAGGHLRGSKVSVAYPADVEFKEKETAAYANIKLTLNILVYGLPNQEAQKVVRNVGSVLAANWQAKMEILSISHHDDHQHDYHQ
ncbi:MAG TPA: hypothetical protein VFC74_01265 [Oscillospiraceae bacterium]|nr:hypothetical protein [Oscillospiraceae bacterium]